MLSRLPIPKTIRWVSNLFMLFLLIFTIFRFITYIAFAPPGIHFFTALPAFALGVQYDLRWIAIMLLPIVLLSIWPQFSPFYSERNKKLWTWYLVIITFIVFFFFAADFGSFSYNQTRLDAGAMNFVEDPGISIRMMWQTYPLLWMIAGLIVAAILFRWMYEKSHWRVVSKTEGKGILHRKKFFIATTLVLVILIYGKFHTTPLKWQDAFCFKDNFNSYLALNPLQNFTATLKFRKPEFNERKAREYFPVIKEWYQLPHNATFPITQPIMHTSTAIESKPNIILVMCESFSMYKSTMSGNPLNTTPFFDSLCRNGIFFNNCFSPHFSTARGLFSIITGIPDVQMFKFSTRNPQAMNQRSLINQLEGYSKHYFLGGSPEFNNFEGLLKNIDGLIMHTEKNFETSRKVNVWGISDRELFMKAHDVFKRADKPFFAYIQTSNNHRPYMIPPTDSAEFKSIYVSNDTLKKYGFESLAEFNTFRYSDFCFKKFITQASNESYFHNTLFIFVGDHGVAGDATAMYPPIWTQQRFTDQHIPLLFYAPYLLSPQKRHEVVSQIDVLPTIAGMLQQPFINYTLGRDLLNPSKKNNFAFITNTSGKIGVITDDYFFSKQVSFSDEYFSPLYTTSIINNSKVDSTRNSLSTFTTAFYETAKYLLLNNKK